MSAAFANFAQNFSSSIGAQPVSAQPRGLYNFILAIRNAQSKEEERTRVDKELANIRQKFAATSNLSSYQKKKYVWKMCYIYMLGYEVDFGHVECVSLISSSKFQEKCVGYMAVSLLVKPGDEMITLVINSVRNDIVGGSQAGQSLALAAVANIGGNEFGDALMADVSKLVRPVNRERPLYLEKAGIEYEQYLAWEILIIKKAILCLLRLFRNSPESLEMEEWSDRIHTLLGAQDLGILTSALSLLTAFASYAPTFFEACIPTVIEILFKLAVERNISEHYKYYKIPSPWIQVKCLKFLQYYPLPEDSRIRDTLVKALESILVKTDSSDGVNKLNAENSVLFEAVHLIIAYGTDLDAALRQQALILLGNFIGFKDANTRFLGLCAMTTLVKINGPDDVMDHIVTVVDACKDSDVSVSKKALDLLFVMTQASNVGEVVAELVVMLSTQHESVKEEIVIKIAILAEKFALSMSWYVDTLVQVILSAGDFVSEDVWFRVVQVVTNQPEVQQYASSKFLAAVQSKVAHPTTITVAGYILGEFGVTICEEPNASGYEQFSALHQHFHEVNHKSQAILLTSYAKFMNLYPDTKPAIEEVLQKLSTSPVLELQQRACEYLMLTKLAPEVMENVLNSMPAYSDNKESLLVTRANKRGKESSGHATISDRGWQTAAAGAAVDPRAPTSVAAAAIAAQTADLLSLHEEEPASMSSPVRSAFVSSNTGSGSASKGGIIRLTAEEETEAEERLLAYTRLPAGQRGVLFENDVLQVSVSSEFRAHQGRIAITLLNKSILDYNALTVTLPSSEAVILKKQDPSTMLAAGEESKFMLAVDCMRPFLGLPEFTLDFNAGNTSYSYSLPLPLTIASFLDAIVVEDRADYMARWKSLEGGDREAQEVFPGRASLDVSVDLMRSIRSSLFPALHLGIAVGLDSETTATACCTLRTGTLSGDGSGATISVGAMVRLEADVVNKRYRLTVRAKHAMVAQSLKTLVKAHLA